jgi:hypothetical protein
MVKPNQEDAVYRYPRDGASPSQAVYQTVAEVKDCDPLELPPLARVIDTDGLNALVEASTKRDAVSSTFEYAGCTVTVTIDEIQVKSH